MRSLVISAAVGTVCALLILQGAHPGLSADNPIPTTETMVPLGTGVMRVLTAGASDGKPVFLLHGATFRAELWQKIGTMAYLAANGFRVIAADLPGHGKSRATGIDRDEVIWQLIRALKLRRPVVLGHSLGGSYALLLVANHADDLSGAVLVAPTKINAYANRLRKKTLPVLLLWGEADRMVPPRRARTLLSMLPNSRLVLLKNAHHECYVEQPDAFHREILRFLKRVASMTSD